MARLKQMAWSSHSFYGHIEATAENMWLQYTHLPLYSHKFSRILWRRKVWIDRCIASLLGTAHMSQPLPQHWTDIETRTQKGMSPAQVWIKVKARLCWRLQFCVLFKVTSKIKKKQSDFSAVTNLIQNMFIISLALLIREFWDTLLERC